jgi:hypothetical protein
VTTSTLDPRALGRATLARQGLLERHPGDVASVVAAVFGLQSQLPDPPYLALAARMDGFTFADLTAALDEYAVVRSTLMRGTLHLVTADDFRWLRPTVQPAVERMFRSAFTRRLGGADVDAVLAAADELLAEQALTHADLKAALGERFGHDDPAALAYAVQYRRMLVQLPPAGQWGRGGKVLVRPAADVLGPLHDGDPAELIRRHLRAFGPATVRDVQTWSGLTGLDEVLARMPDDIQRLEGPDGQQLIDLPGAARPDADQPAPVRLLPEFDSLLLAHHDRRRVMTGEVRARVCVGSAVAATVLVDGVVDGIWTWARRRGGIEVRPFGRWSTAVQDAVEAEGVRLLELAGTPQYDVVLRSPE